MKVILVNKNSFTIDTYNEVAYINDNSTEWILANTNPQFSLVVSKKNYVLKILELKEE